MQAGNVSCNPALQGQCGMCACHDGACAVVSQAASGLDFSQAPLCVLSVLVCPARLVLSTCSTSPRVDCTRICATRGSSLQDFIFISNATMNIFEQIPVHSYGRILKNESPVYIPSNIVFTLHFLNYSKVATLTVTHLLRCLGTEPATPFPGTARSPFLCSIRGKRKRNPWRFVSCGAPRPWFSRAGRA